MGIYNYTSHSTTINGVLEPYVTFNYNNGVLEQYLTYNYNILGVLQLYVTFNYNSWGFRTIPSHTTTIAGGSRTIRHIQLQ